jgi:hypothetical protein
VLESSILNSTKKALGIHEDDTSFDPEILMHINSVLSTLHQLGIGPDAGFMVEDETATWGDFLGSEDPRFSSIRSYVYLRVRLIFDPPTTSFAIEAFKEQVRELEWRLNVVREGDQWIDPLPAP